MVAVHRMLVESSMGRYLLPGEQVHHIDRNKINNKLDNLKVLSINEHRRLHATEDSPNRGARAHADKMFDVIKLRKEGKYAREIGEKLGIPRRTVQRYLQENSLGGHSLKVSRRKRDKKGRFV